ncbi:HET-domain-containing protein [Ophiobolus disseminans]|uniref:HET-domain-containing protein n=1 Tax=Ophiobolus disseminans TaxID=1469910 RepID=A0A6A6ZGP4_9PLEO|nr:HET-domain-containing protein [Ophiobolus disseminans]
MAFSLRSKVGQYQHVPLDYTKNHIRLVRLKPSLTNADAIDCEIVIADLDKPPPYSTLSYTWGPPTPSHQIYIENKALKASQKSLNDRSRRRIIFPIGKSRMSFGIRDNLFRFLEEFRKRRDKEHSDWYLWIDQLSIDQTNPAERNHQVQMMSKIYSSCESVIVWLGDGSTSHTAFDTEYEAAKRHGDDKALAVIFLNGYFERLWIVQEFVLARRIRLLIKDIWVIKDHIDYTAFMKKAQPLLEQQASSSALDLFNARALRYQRPHRVHYERIEALITRFGRHGCEDPRDKLYGLSGLVSPEQRIEVDYGRSKQQVFMDIALLLCTAYVHDSDIATEQQSKAQLELLKDVSLQMGFTQTQQSSLEFLLRMIWYPGRGDKGRLIPCAITAMGFDAAEECMRIFDRWWIEITGTKFYVECTDWEADRVKIVVLETAWKAASETVSEVKHFTRKPITAPRRMSDEYFIDLDC